MTKEKPIPFLLWPFYALWKLVSTVLLLTGRLVTMIIGFILMIAGIILTVTVVGAIVGIPLALIGFLLVLRGIF